jgi:DNA-binding response OmpR family regulator
MNILIVENDPYSGGMLARRLRSKGYAPSAVGTVAEAIERSSALAPDVIVLDVGEFGTACRDIIGPLKHNKKTKSIPTLVLSSSCSGHASCARCEYFVMKPITLEDVTRVIHDFETRVAAP